MDFLTALATRAAAASAAEQSVARVAFHGILAGKPVRVTDVCHAAALPPAPADAALRALAARGAIAFDETSETIVVARGLSLRPTRHGVTLMGHHAPLFASCAVDAVGIPAALGSEAVVTSCCYHCSAPLTVTTDRTAVTAPAGLRIWAPDDDGRASVREFT